MDDRTSEVAQPSELATRTKLNAVTHIIDTFITH